MTTETPLSKKIQENVGVYSANVVGVYDLRQTLKEVMSEIDFLDIDLFFIDVKDEKGNIIPESKQLMDLFNLFWVHLKPKIKQLLLTKFGEELIK